MLIKPIAAPSTRGTILDEGSANATLVWYRAGCRRSPVVSQSWSLADSKDQFRIPTLVRTGEIGTARAVLLETTPSSTMTNAMYMRLGDSQMAL